MKLESEAGGWVINDFVNYVKSSEFFLAVGMTEGP